MNEQPSQPPDRDPSAQDDASRLVTSRFMARGSSDRDPPAQDNVSCPPEKAGISSVALFIIFAPPLSIFFTIMLMIPYRYDADNIHADADSLIFDLIAGVILGVIVTILGIVVQGRRK